MHFNAISGKRPTSIKYLSQAAVATANTTYTFSSQSLGTMMNRRNILCACTSGQSSGGKSVTGITIDGVSMTQIYADVTTAGQDPFGLFTKPWPTGDTATFAVTFNASMARCAIFIYGISSDYEPSTFLFDHQSDKVLSTSNLNVDIAVPAGGVVLGLASFTISGGSPNVTWTGLTEDIDISTNQFSGSSLFSPNQQTINVNASGSGTLISNRCIMHVMSFR